LLPPDTGLAESSAMATVAIMVIPLLFVLRQHSLLLPFPKLRTGFYIFYGITCLTAMIGTGARTGLVCVAVLAVLIWQRSRHKLVAAVAVVLIGALLFAFAPQRWHSRMSTIDDFNQETSALTRIRIWQWSLDFVRDHPLGGGFRAYEVSVIQMPPDAFNPEGWIQRGRAPHSTWFEVLTELGYPGAIMFAALIGLTFLTLYRARRRTRGIPDLAWAHDLSLGLIHALLILMAGATFIGIGFKPWFWLLFSASFALSECVRRSLAEPAKVARFVPVSPAPTPVRGLAARGLMGRGGA
jgi:probable O-glycosylation ligase (exosortase A-associated)